MVHDVLSHFRLSFWALATFLDGSLITIRAPDLSYLTSLRRTGSLKFSNYGKLASNRSMRLEATLLS